MSLENRIKEERERLRYSQTDFAAIGGASKGSQIAWEKGGVFPNASVLSAWATVGVDVLYILTGRHEIQIEDEEGPVNPIGISILALEIARAFNEIGLTSDKFGSDTDYPYSGVARWAARIGMLCGEINNSLLSLPAEDAWDRDAIRKIAMGAALSEKSRLQGVDGPNVDHIAFPRKKAAK